MGSSAVSEVAERAVGRSGCDILQTPSRLFHIPETSDYNDLTLGLDERKFGTTAEDSTTFQLSTYHHVFHKFQKKRVVEILLMMSWMLAKSEGNEEENLTTINILLDYFSCKHRLESYRERAFQSSTKDCFLNANAPYIEPREKPRFARECANPLPRSNLRRNTWESTWPRRKEGGGVCRFSLKANACWFPCF